MDRYTEEEAKAQWTSLVGRAQTGETIGITRRGEVVAWLKPPDKRSQANSREAREAARRLAALGGSDPHATAPPRRRFD